MMSLPPQPFQSNDRTCQSLHPSLATSILKTILKNPPSEKKHKKLRSLRVQDLVVSQTQNKKTPPECPHPIPTPPPSSWSFSRSKAVRKSSPSKLSKCSDFSKHRTSMLSPGEAVENTRYFVGKSPVGIWG